MGLNFENLYGRNTIGLTAIHLFRSRYYGAGRAIPRPQSSNQHDRGTTRVRAPRCMLFRSRRCSQTPPETRCSHQSLSGRWNSHIRLRTITLPSGSPPNLVRTPIDADNREMKLAEWAAAHLPACRTEAVGVWAVCRHNGMISFLIFALL
jgi:hypothetical protein